MGYFDDFTTDNQESQNQGLSTVTPKINRPYVKERGFLGDTASSLGRGVLGLTKLSGHAFETVTGKDIGLDEWAEKTRENVDFFKQDRSEYLGKKGFIGRGWQGAMESIVPSLSAAAPGAAIGGAIGAVPGAIIGGMISTLGLFGAGTYGEAKEEALAQGLDEQMAHEYALKKGVIEGGIETAATGIEIGTAGIGKFFTTPVKQTLKQMVKMSAKDIGKVYAKTTGTEVGTEMLQAGLGAQTDIDYGMGETPVHEAVAESIMPALFMSGIFVTGAQGYNSRQKAKLRRALESDNTAVRQSAADVLYQNVKKEDPELAEGWKSHMEKYGNEPLDLNMTMTEMFQEAKNNETLAAEKEAESFGKRVDPLGDIDSLTTVVDAKLKAAGNVPIGEAELTDEYVKEFDDARLRELQVKNLPKDLMETEGYSDLEVEQQRKASEDAVRKANVKEQVGRRPDVEEVTDEASTDFKDIALQAVREKLGVEEFQEVPPTMGRKERKAFEKKARQDVRLANEPKVKKAPTKGEPADVSDKAMAEQEKASEIAKKEANTRIQRAKKEQEIADRPAPSLQYDKENYEVLEPADQIVAEMEESREDATRRRMAKATQKDKGLTDEETVTLESVMKKDVYGVPLTEEEQLVANKVRPTGQRDVLVEGKQEAYVSDPETGQRYDEELEAKRTQEIADKATAVTGTGDQGLVATTASPEELVEAYEEGQLVEAEELETDDSTREVSETAQLFKDTKVYKDEPAKKIKTLVTKIEKERKKNPIEGKPTGKAGIFDELAAEMRKEAQQDGWEAEFDEGLQEARDHVTGKESSRRDSKLTLGWEKDASDTWSATTRSGKAFIVTTPQGRQHTLMYRDGKGKPWVTVLGKGKLNLQQMAEDYITEGTVPTAKKVISEKDMTQADLDKMQKQAKPKIELTEEEKIEKKVAERLAKRKEKGDVLEEEVGFEGEDVDTRGPVDMAFQEGRKDSVGYEVNDEGEVDVVGDVDIKTGEAVMSAAVKNRLEGGKRATNAKVIAEEIFMNPKNPVAKRVLGLLLKTSAKDKLENLEIKHVSQTDKSIGGRSFYDPNTNTIYYSDQASERTLAHEIVHGVTVAELDALGPKHKVSRDISRVAKAYGEWLGGEGTEVSSTVAYAFQNAREFLAVAMSDPSVQADLKQIPVAPGERTGTIKTLWDKVVNGIRKVFRLPTEYHSALEEIIGITSDLSSMDVAKVAAKKNPLIGEYMAQGLNFYEAAKLARGLQGDYSKMSQESMLKTQEWIDKAAEQEANDKQWFMDPLKKAVKGVDKFITPVSEVVRDIAPRVHQLLLKMEKDINLKNKNAHDKVGGFAAKYNKLDKKVKDMMDLYLLNSNNPEDAKVLEEMLRENGMTEEFAEVQKVLDGIRDGYDDVGLNVFNRIDNYFPRKVKDVKGLMAYLRMNTAKKEGTEVAGGTGIFDDILEDTKLSEKEKEEAIASRVNTGYNPATALRIPSSAKSRSIQKVKVDMMKYYQSPMDALIDTVYEANEAIETRKFVGVTARKKLTKDLNREYEKLKKAKSAKGKEAIETKINVILSKLEKYGDIGEVSDQSVASFLQKHGGNLDPDQQSDLTSALRSRLNQKGMSGVTARIRDLGLITALGSPLNAITQIGDLVWSIYENGPVNTVKAVFGDKEVTTKDLDMSHVLKEFSQGSTAKWVDKTLKWTGFSFMDQFGKNVNMQAAINKARDTPKAEFVKKWSDSLTPETADKVWEDIKKGETTEDVKHFVFSSVSKFQPVSLSEMPQKYLESGNGRIFYTLKSYGIKALSNLRREVIGEFKKGNTKQASKNLMTLLPLLVLANASVDELKDWILGRDDAFSDQVWDNLLKLGFASRYTVDKGLRQGKMVSTFFKDVLTPPGIGVADPFLGDLYNLIADDKEVTYKSLNSVPFIGKLAYSKTPEGISKQSDRKRTQLYSDIRDSVSSGNFNDVRKRITKYNKEQRKIGGKIIDNKTIRTLKSRERKKLRDET